MPVINSGEVYDLSNGLTAGTPVDFTHIIAARGEAISIFSEGVSVKVFIKIDANRLKYVDSGVGHFKSSFTLPGQEFVFKVTASTHLDSDPYIRWDFA